MSSTLSHQTSLFHSSLLYLFEMEMKTTNLVVQTIIRRPSSLPPTIFSYFSFPSPFYSVFPINSHLHHLPLFSTFWDENWFKITVLLLIKPQNPSHLFLSFTSISIVLSPIPLSPSKMEVKIKWKSNWKVCVDHDSSLFSFIVTYICYSFDCVCGLS